MELVLEGYKQTEVGLIPEDWLVKTIEEISVIDPENLSNSTNHNFVFEYISLEDVNNGILKGTSEIIFRNAPSRARRVIKKGDILISTVRPNLKSHFFVNQFIKDWVCSTGFAVIRTNGSTNNKYVYNHFFGRIINHQIDNLITGSNYPAISNKDVRTLKIPLPPTLKEEQAIATALSDVDAFISSLDELIAKKKAIKQGAMQQLLTPPDKGGKRLPGFDGEWEEKMLGELCEKIQDGNYGESYPKRDEFISFGIPFLTSKAIGKNGILIESKIDYISLGKHKELLKAHLQIADILFTNRGASVGAIGYVDKRISHGNIGPQLTLIRANKSMVSSRFLFHSLKSDSVQKQINSNDSGSAMNFFGIGETSKFKIQFPLKIEEQKAIAQIFSDMDAELEQLEAKKVKYQQIKQGMMQELLTGKTRLV